MTQARERATPTRRDGVHGQRERALLERRRFQVRARIPRERAARAGTPLTGNTGHFWFFSGNNLELIVKVVDGRSLNGRFWVFSGALSNVEYTITVTDTLTGSVKTYVNPSGSLVSLADTSAF